MAGEDRILARREENRERKRIHFEARKAKEVKQRGTLETDSLHDSSEDTADDHEIYVPSPKRVKRNESVALKVPRKTIEFLSLNLFSFLFSFFKFHLVQDEITLASPSDDVTNRSGRVLYEHMLRAHT